MNHVVDAQPLKLPIGISDFVRLRQERYTFVDKSLFIKEVIDDGAVAILLTRPRRFGKTLNMSMLAHFFDVNTDNADYFKDLAIWQQGDHYQNEQGKYPVIFISFRDIKSKSFDEAYAKLCTIIRKLYQQFKNDVFDTLVEYEQKIYQDIIALGASKIDIEDALKNLTEYLFRHYKVNPIILIDEYDSPIHASYIHDYYDDMIDFMRALLGAVLKDNRYLKKGILTGILRVGKESIFSGMNNLRVHTVISRQYGTHFGFLEHETESLLKIAKTSAENIVKTKKWYNGYHFNDIIIYNPWSIINFIVEQFTLKPYWVNTSDNHLIGKLILDASSVSQNQFEHLLQQKCVTQHVAEDIVFTDLRRRDNTIWNFLLHTGYLTLAQTTQDESGFLQGEFIIPNNEVAFVYKSLINRWFNTQDTPSVSKMLKSLLAGDIAGFKTGLGHVLQESFSYFDTQGKTREQIYHVFVLGLVATLSDHYMIRSNRESGNGRYDVVMIPKDKARAGIVFEFKALANGATAETLEKSANTALTQIQTKKYLTEFQQAEIQSVIQLGIAFSGKNFIVADAKI